MDIKQMNVLIACEESQTVCKAFRSLGHRAFSADLQECSGGGSNGGGGDNNGGNNNNPPSGELEG